MSDPDAISRALMPDEDLAALIKNYVDHSKKGYITEEDAETLVAWAHAIRFHYTMLELILAGEVAIVGFNEDGEPLISRAKGEKK